MDEISIFISKARERGKSDEEIRDTLIAGGWNIKIVNSALEGLSVPLPPSMNNTSTNDNQKPIAVTHTSSTRGFEYTIMFLSLWVAAVSFAVILDSFISSIGSNGSGFGIKFSLVVLIVFLPIFITLFVRTKRAEKQDMSIRQDSSRKHAVQLTMLVTFVMGLGYTVFFLYTIISGNNGSGSKLRSFLYFLVTVLISGSIFTYYWIDDHKKGTSGFSNSS